MPNIAQVNITKHPTVIDYYNMRITIDKRNAFIPLDEGIVELLCVNQERVKFELKEYKKLGYTIEPEAVVMLRDIGFIN